MFEMFRDRASVPKEIKDFHLQIYLKRKKTGKSPVGQDTNDLLEHDEKSEIYFYNHGNDTPDP